MTGGRTLEQLHFGGGTPTFLSNEELGELMQILTRRFPLEEKGEFSIEVDPRSTPPDKVRALAALGFNRMSCGVQDFDPDVQKAVNRIQPFEMTRETIEAARASGFKSVNLDLISACRASRVRASPARSTRCWCFRPSASRSTTTRTCPTASSPSAASIPKRSPARPRRWAS
jgi:coproporphyrinogen III oxidase-like Fe-S oxidoreductase